MIGAGYVGLVTGVCFSEVGNSVVCADIDESKIKLLNDGISPIYEPGLEDMMLNNIDAKRLTFTSNVAEAVENSDLIFICVGTPQDQDGSANLDYIFSAAKAIGESLNDYKIIIVKSTVPVGSCAKVYEIIKENRKQPTVDFDVISNPEFLKEGSAIKDFMEPDRVVIGINGTHDLARLKERVTELYSSLVRANRPLIFTTIESSELTKYASNAMLATRISFMNELSHLAEKVGADIKEISKAMGFDTRIGPRFLQAGIGYGGSCFPKDVRALINTLKVNDCQARILQSVDDVNEDQKLKVIELIKDIYGTDLSGKKFALWGLSFKPKTDDVREAPSIIIAKGLIELGATVTGYDPLAMDNFKKYVPDITLSQNEYDCLNYADALILITEYDEFRNPEFDRIKSLLKGHTIIDGRNIYSPNLMVEKGFTYYGIGRR